MSQRGVKLNQRVDIEQRESGEDALGQPVERWTLLAAVWADVRYQAGLEAVKANADVSIVRASVRIRHRSGLHAGLRVVHAGRVLDVAAVLPDGKRQYVDLVCQGVQ